MKWKVWMRSLFWLKVQEESQDSRAGQCRPHRIPAGDTQSHGPVSQHQNRTIKPTWFFTGFRPPALPESPPTPPVYPPRKNVKRGKGSAGGYCSGLRWEDNANNGETKAPSRGEGSLLRALSPLQPREAGRPRTCQGRRTKEGTAEWGTCPGWPWAPLRPSYPPAHLFPPLVQTKANIEGSLNFQLVFQMK